LFGEYINDFTIFVSFGYDNGISFFATNTVNISHYEEGVKMDRWQEIVLFIIAIILIIILILFSPRNEDGARVVSPEINTIINQIPGMMQQLADE